VIHWRCHGRSGEIVYSWHVLMERIEANAEFLDLFIAHKERGSLEKAPEAIQVMIRWRQTRSLGWIEFSW